MSKRHTGRRLSLLLPTVVLSFAMSGCLNGAPQAAAPHASAPSRPGQSITGPGNGDFSFEPEGPLAGRPIRVWYHAPAGDLATASILVVMPGTKRDGRAYRSDWLPLLKDQNVLLLVPEFSEKQYPGVSSYNLGNMVDRHGELNPEDTWSFAMIEALFDHVVADTHSTATDYAMFGHSAGAQFVHRFIVFAPQSRARVAVAANAGWYTVLNDSAPFPYGLNGAPPGTDLSRAFSRHLIVMLGADDTNPHDSSLQRDKHTDKQGIDRLERGLNFYTSARSAAGEANQFNWRKSIIPGVAHSHAEMARAALPFLIDPTAEEH